MEIDGLTANDSLSDADVNSTEVIFEHARSLERFPTSRTFRQSKKKPATFSTLSVIHLTFLPILYSTPNVSNRYD